MRNDPNLGKARSVQKVVETYDLVDRYEFIALLDADTLVDVAYFTEILKSFDDQEAVVSCGRPISTPYNWLAAYRGLAYTNGHYVARRAQAKMGAICIAPGCSTTYRSRVFKKLEWGADTVAEDTYITIQVHHDELGKVVYAGEAKVYTQTPRTLYGYMKQKFRWDVGTWQVIRLLRVYWGKKRVDWECKLLWTEGLITATIRLLTTLFLLVSPVFFPVLPWYTGFIAIPLVLIGRYLISLPVVLIFAWLTKRWDIVLYSPTFPLISYIDSCIFLLGFWRAIVQKKSIGWFTPARYIA